MKKNLIIIQLLLILFGFTSCTSTYFGPRNYVGFYSEDDIVTSNQFTLDPGKDNITSTYEEEFVYDDEGNMIKSKQTEYFDRDSKSPKFIVWETEYKVLGDHVVPSKAYVNGELYSSVDYDVLEVTAEGPIVKDVTEAFFYKETKLLFQKPLNQIWRVSLLEYPVPYSIDDKFVRNVETFSPYSGYRDDSILNIGFDNIVVNKYYYSYDKLLNGISKSLPYGSSKSRKLQSLTNGYNITFEYKWDSIADKACPTEVIFVSQNNDKVNAHMIVKMAYNNSGLRTDEEWIVLDTDTPEMEEIVVFKQDITY